MDKTLSNCSSTDKTWRMVQPWTSTCQKDNRDEEELVHQQKTWQQMKP